MNHLLIGAGNLLLGSFSIYLATHIFDQENFEGQPGIVWSLFKGLVIINFVLLLILLGFAYSHLGKSPTFSRETDRVIHAALSTRVGSQPLYLAVWNHRLEADKHHQQLSVLKETNLKNHEQGYLLDISFTAGGAIFHHYTFFIQNAVVYTVNPNSRGACPIFPFKEIPEAVQFDILNDISRAAVNQIRENPQRIEEWSF